MLAGALCWPSRGGLTLEKRAIEISRLVRWAYVEELPKGYRDGKLGQSAEISPMFSVASHGTRVDNWSIEPGYPLAMGTDPHPDALTIHAAVMDLQDNIIVWPSAADALLGELAQYLTEGERFAAQKMRVQVPGLVKLHAILGNQPIWQLDYQVIRRIGRERKSVLRKGRGSVRMQGEVTLDIPASAILEARFEYLSWHSALRELARINLREHHALPPTAPQQPWINPDTARVLPDRHAKPMDARALASGRAWGGPYLPLAPKRRSPLPQRPAATHGPVRHVPLQEAG